MLDIERSRTERQPTQPTGLEALLTESRQRLRAVADAAERLRRIEGSGADGGVRARVSATGALSDLRIEEVVLAGGPEEVEAAVVRAVEAARADAEEQVRRLGSTLPGLPSGDRIADLLAGRGPVIPCRR